MPLLLNRQDVIDVLDMQECMQVVESAFAELANGTAMMPLRNNIRNEMGLSLYMPAYLKELGALACKVVSVYKNNPAKYQLPTTIGKVLLQNPETGEVISIMDGGYLTAVRTGAASGVATRYLSRKTEPQTVAIFGAGVQAGMQLWAVSVAKKIEKAWVFDIQTSAAENFASQWEKRLGFPVYIASTADEMLQADIICTATSANNPLFDGNKVKPGTHINGIGSHTPVQRELDTAIVKRSLFIGDSREACFGEAGDLLIPIQEGAISEEHYYASLGEIITGKKLGRTDNNQITLFKSNGLAIQDAATALLVYNKAKSIGKGIHIEI